MYIQPSEKGISPMNSGMTIQWGKLSSTIPFSDSLFPDIPIRGIVLAMILAFPQKNETYSQTCVGYKIA